MAKSQRDKGNREELAVVHTWQDAGFAAEKIPLSGMGRKAGSAFFGDVTIPLVGSDRPFEVKVRGDGFRELYKWLDGAFGVFVRADRKQRLVVLREADFIEIIKQAERAKQ